MPEVDVANCTLIRYKYDTKIARTPCSDSINQDSGVEVSMSSVGISLLRMLSRDPDAVDVEASTPGDQQGDPLVTYRKEFPESVLEMIPGSTVLDFGCGIGKETIGFLENGAAKVIGFDTHKGRLDEARRRKRADFIHCEAIQFTHTLEKYWGGIDVVVSQNAVEHFQDLPTELKRIACLLRPGGHAIIHFCPLWLSPYGAHMHYFTAIPWVHVIFDESTVMEVRSIYADEYDSADSYEDLGLGKVTLERWEEALEEVDLVPIFHNYSTVKGLSVVDNIPWLREFLTNRVAAVLKKSRE